MPDSAEQPQEAEQLPDMDTAVRSDAQQPAGLPDQPQTAADEAAHAGSTVAHASGTADIAGPQGEPKKPPKKPLPPFAMQLRFRKARAAPRATQSLVGSRPATPLTVEDVAAIAAEAASAAVETNFSKSKDLLETMAHTVRSAAASAAEATRSVQVIVQSKNGLGRSAETSSTQSAEPEITPTPEQFLARRSSFLAGLSSKGQVKESRGGSEVLYPNPAFRESPDETPGQSFYSAQGASMENSVTASVVKSMLQANVAPLRRTSGCRRTSSCGVDGGRGSRGFF
jgi:hypothetical protein